jgi:hypothetical protein
MMKNDDIEFLPDMLENETAKAYKAMVDYLRMGPSRSITKLYAMYHEKGMEHTPTEAKSDRTLRGWSSHYQWVERAKAYDVKVQKCLEQGIKERRLALLDSFGKIVEDAMGEVDLLNVSLSQLTGALREYLTQSMSLFNELPRQTIAFESDLTDMSTADLKREAARLIADLKNENE